MTDDILFKTLAIQNIKGRPYVTYQSQYFFLFTVMYSCVLFARKTNPLLG